MNELYYLTASHVGHEVYCIYYNTTNVALDCQDCDELVIIATKEELS